MNIIHLSKRGSHLNTMEKFYIYKETKMDNQSNDKNMVSCNKIFQTILSLDAQLTGRGKQSPVSSLNTQTPEQATALQRLHCDMYLFVYNLGHCLCTRSKYVSKFYIHAY